MWRDVVDIWDRDGVGYEIPDVLDPSRHFVYNHAIWADNIYLIADTAQKTQHLVTSFTDVLLDWGPSWKRSSLELLVAGDQSPCVVQARVHDQIVDFKRVEKLSVLGTFVSSKFDQYHEDIRGRTDCARRAFFAQISYVK